MTLTIHIPLSLAVLCADCNSIFAIGPEACPCCTSGTLIPVQSLIERTVAADGRRR